MLNRKNEMAQETVQNYLSVWAPHLLEDKDLVSELHSEAFESPDGVEHDKVHAYFMAWCATRTADLCTAGGGIGMRAQRDSLLWRKITESDRLAAAEFWDIRSTQLRVQTWFSERVDEVLEILRDMLGERAEAAIDNLDEWLMKGFQPGETRKRRLLVKTVALLREEFGTATGRPEIPPPPDPEEQKATLLGRLKEDAKKARQKKKEDARAALQNLRNKRFS